MYVEAWAGFISIFVMTMDCGIGEATAQLTDQSAQRYTLLSGAGVLGFAVGVQTADIADTDTAIILSAGMCTYYTEGTTFFDRAVQFYDIVITDVVETSG